MSKKRRKKPNKQQRERMKAEKANIFNEGFTMGFNMGYEQGFKDAAEKGERECRKWACYGR